MKSKKGVAEDNSQVVFLEHKRKKRWVDKESGGNCYMIYARSLFITWGGHDHYWDWKCFKESGEENIDVAKLCDVCWLDIRGKFNISDLTSGLTYDVVYEVKLTKAAKGWEIPIRAKLSLPSGKVQERQIIMFGKPRGEWFEINVGSFKTMDEVGEVCFDIFEHGGHWKSGLIIKGTILRPNNRPQS